MYFKYLMHFKTYISELFCSFLDLIFERTDGRKWVPIRRTWNRKLWLKKTSVGEAISAVTCREGCLINLQGTVWLAFSRPSAIFCFWGRANWIFSFVCPFGRVLATTCCSLSIFDPIVCLHQAAAFVPTFFWFGPSNRLLVDCQHLAT